MFSSRSCRRGRGSESMSQGDRRPARYPRLSLIHVASPLSISPSVRPFMSADRSVSTCAPVLCHLHESMQVAYALHCSSDLQTVIVAGAHTFDAVMQASHASLRCIGTPTQKLVPHSCAHSPGLLQRQ